MRLPGRAAAFLLAAAAVQGWPLTAAAVEVGEPAPPITGPRADGSSFELSELSGDIVYVDFWASWCAPCRAAMPRLDELHASLGARGFSVVGVNVDRKRRSAERMLEQVPVDFPVVFDPEGQWAERYALPGMPSGYLIDGDGVVRYRHTGYREGDLPKLANEIEKLLEENQP
ncbi:TlpA disulfide reductase family protein [Algiphilus sp.]|uniref:TlpA family protein disulfide reductase n=1 Tax=Algiphilus sp. TaxID=1872431 RepID=UPI0025C1DB4A|nr:TlpA disulfide reductase family protein [Algiphilus sp.]MCK5769813.1 TlpA family protein disulfide reductase [Algiphilus sp.]